MSNVYNKEKITQIVQESLPTTIEDRYLTIEKLLFKWWSTGRTGHCMRLTDEGMQAFLDADIAHYDFVINFKDIFPKQTKKAVNKFIVNLGKQIKCPFYVFVKPGQKTTTYIRIYDSKIAMMINLYGNIAEYLESVKVK